MTTAAYMSGRFEYDRPQAVLFADNSGLIVDEWKSSGLVATLSAGSDSVILTTGTTANIIPGYNIEVTSGSGAFAIGAKVKSIISATEFTVTVNHTTSGSATFRVGTFLYVPDGEEFTNFLVLSDHNRSPLDFSTDRIERRERMINGRMRSYHIADKLNISMSWNLLPSRSHAGPASFNAYGQSIVTANTVDNGAGGNDLKQWYDENKGSFWVYLAYDKYKNFGDDAAAYAHLHQYNEILEMYISDFSYSVQKRGANNLDMWDISVTLEEA